MSSSVKKLSCGGKGPCCHVGYAHRHCEHCDVVIDLRTQFQWWPNGTLPYPQAPRPYWNGNDIRAAAAASIGVYPSFMGNTGDFGKALPEHSCEVTP